MITIPLTQGLSTIIDDIDKDLTLYKWGADYSTAINGYYAKRTINRSSKRLHCVILERMLGRALEKSEKTDHINGNGLDNRRENLRVATHTQNMQNSKIRITNKSGYKGVCLNKASGKYIAQVSIDSNKLWLGNYTTAEQAHAVYNETAKHYFKEFNRE